VEHVLDKGLNAPEVPISQSSSALLSEVLARWPSAPVSGVGETGRWLTFERSGGPTIYLQRYAWDDRTVPCYLVAVPTGADWTEQQRHWTLDEAIAAVKRLLVSRPL
jgi:hypothetical protein